MNQPDRVICIGIDLAWSYKNRSGISILELRPKKRTLTLLGEPAWALTDDEIICIVNKARSNCTILAIDAPIIAPNKPGTGRPCDREVSRAFGKFEAAAHSANRKRCKRPIKLRQLLEKEGFSSNPHHVKNKPGLWQIEVYPHPAQVVLFDLDKTLKYKKGLMDHRREQLNILGGHIKTKLNEYHPRLKHNPTLQALCETNREKLRGKEYKEREDILDSIICGYIAAYYWTWRERKCRIFGDIDTGYIITPKPPKT